MHRRSFAWVVAIVLALAGTQVAHTLAYDLAAAGPQERAHLLEEAGHGYLSYLPLGLAFATAILALALVSEVRLVVAGATTRPPSFWSFAALAPLLFACQEHFERLVHDGAFPWTVVSAPTFAIGIALQLPFALVAYVLARLLLRAARSLGRLLAAPPRALAAGSGRRWPAVTAVLLRPSALSLGYGTRGPPFSLAA